MGWWWLDIGEDGEEGVQDDFPVSSHVDWVNGSDHFWEGIEEKQQMRDWEREGWDKMFHSVLDMLNMKFIVIHWGEDVQVALAIWV